MFYYPKKDDQQSDGGRAQMIRNEERRKLDMDRKSLEEERMMALKDDIWTKTVKDSERHPGEKDLRRPEECGEKGKVKIGKDKEDKGMCAFNRYSMYIYCMYV